MFGEFFSGRPSEAPVLNVVEHALLIIVLFLLLYASTRWYHKTWYRSFFWWLQLIQIVSLYTWYIAVSYTLAENLPFYHCRFAMFFILFAKPSPLKRYFAYLGVFGSLVAMSYPVFDLFPFPHLTFFSFVFGHYALAVNSLLYLLRTEETEKLDSKKIVGYTLGLNSFILLANMVLNANYGYLMEVPIIKTYFLPFNFLFVSVGLIAGISFIQWVFYAYVTKHKVVYATRHQ